MIEGTFSTPQPVEDKVAKKLHTVAQYILVAVFGLLPILFLPMVEFSLAYTKTFAVIVATFTALTLYSFAVLRTGKFSISMPPPVIALWLLVIAGAASALLSGDVRDAFFGNFLENQTVAFLIALALIVTVSMNVLTNRRMIYRLYVLLSLSTLLLALFHIIRIFFGANALSFGVFGGNQVLTPVGSWNDLAIFFGLTILLSIVALEQLPLVKQGKILFGVVTVFALMMLAIVNFSPVWYVLGIVSLIVLIYSLARDRMTPEWLKGSLPDRNVSMHAIAMSGVVFATAFIFIAGGSVIGARISAMTGISYVEVRPSIQATTGVIGQVYGHDAIFGIGPNKFVDAWRLYRDPSLNSTIFWNTDFYAGVGYIPTFFVTMGIVGGLIWIGFLGLFIQLGIKTLLGAPEPDRMWYFIATSSFVSGLFLWLMSVIYVPGPMLVLLAALCTGLLLSARNALEPHHERVVSLAGNRRSGFILVSVVMLVMLVSLSGLYTIGRHYASAFLFAKGERTLGTGDVEGSKALSIDAATLMNDDRYLRRIAELEYSDLIQVLNSPADTPNLEVRFRTALQNGIAVASRSTALDGTDANNWGLLGALFSAVVPLKIDGAYDRAKEALDKAKELDPQNPIRTLMLARLEYGQGNVDGARDLMNEALKQKPDYLDAALMLSQLEIAAGNIDAAIDSTVRTIQIDSRNPARYFQLGVLELAKNDIDTGIGALEAAVTLDPQYANARYYLAFAYDAKGEKDKAKEQLNKVLETNPDNAEVKDLLSKLARGEKISETQPPAQQSAVTTTSEAPQSVEEKPDSPLLTPVNPIPETQTEEDTATDPTTE